MPDEEAESQEAKCCGGHCSRVDSSFVLLVLAGSLCYFLNDGISYAFGIIYADLRQTFEQSAAATAVLPAMVDAVPQFSAIITCPFVQAIGCGAAATIGTIFVVVGFFSSTFVKSLAPLYFTIGVVSAVGLELVYVAALAVAAVPESKNRGLAVGLTVCGSGLGSIFFSYTLPALLDRYFWAGTFLVVSAIFLHTFPAAIIFYSRFDRCQPSNTLSASRPPREMSTIHSSAECVDESHRLVAPPQASKFALLCSEIGRQFLSSIRMIFTKHVWMNAEFLVFATNEFVHGLTMVVPESLLFDHLLNQGFGTWEAATCQSLFSGFSTVGHVGWGIIGDRWHVINVYCFAQLGTALLVILLGYINHFVVMAIVVSVAGFFRGANETLYCLVYIGDLGSDHFFAGLVVLLIVVGCGNMIGTPMGGFIYDRTKSYSSAFTIAGIILSAATVLLFIARKLLAWRKVRLAAAYENMHAD